MSWLVIVGLIALYIFFGSMVATTCFFIFEGDEGDIGPTIMCALFWPIIVALAIFAAPALLGWGIVYLIAKAVKKNIG